LRIIKTQCILLKLPRDTKERNKSEGKKLHLKNDKERAALSAKSRQRDKR